MSLDLRAALEKRLDLPVAAEKRLTLGRAGKVVGRSIQTLWRWSLKPNRYGIVLRTCVVGGVRYTTEGWLADYIAQSTAAADEHSAYASQPTPKRRDRIDAARRELARR